MIDLNAFSSASMTGPPYRWAWVRDFVEAEQMRELCRTFPTEGFVLREGGAANPYRSIGRRLVHLGSSEVVPDPDLAPCWRDLAEQLLTDEYRRAVSELTGLDLTDAGLQVSIYRNDPSCALPPHTDDEPKILTQTLYFNADWDETWGGELLMLGSDDMDDVVGSIPPKPANSVVHVRSSASWHAVPALKNDGGQAQERRSMTIAFYDQPETWADIYGDSPLGSVLTRSPM